MKTSLEAKPRLIRDKAFAKRLNSAIEEHPRAPTDMIRGKQKWLYDQLLERYGIKITPEGARKWFVGENRPRPKVIKAIADILGVDEAWLSLGITPELTEIDKKKRNAVAIGAVNYVAGVLQLHGGSIAFPEEGSEKPCDFYAIVKGRQYLVEVKSISMLAPGSVKLHIASKQKNCLIFVVVAKDDRFELVQIPVDLILHEGRLRGGFTEIEISSNGNEYFVGLEKLSIVNQQFELAPIAA